MNVRFVVSPELGEPVFPKSVRSKKDRIAYFEQLTKEFRKKFEKEFPQYRIVNEFSALTSLIVEVPTDEAGRFPLVVELKLGANAGRADGKFFKQT